MLRRKRNRRLTKQDFGLQLSRRGVATQSAHAQAFNVQPQLFHHPTLEKTKGKGNDGLERGERWRWHALNTKRLPPHVCAEDLNIDSSPKKMEGHSIPKRFLKRGKDKEALYFSLRKHSPETSSLTLSLSQLL